MLCLDYYCWSWLRAHIIDQRKFIDLFKNHLKCLNFHLNLIHFSSFALFFLKIKSFLLNHKLWNNLFGFRNMPVYLIHLSKIAEFVRLLVILCFVWILYRFPLFCYGKWRIVAGLDCERAINLKSQFFSCRNFDF